MVIKNEHVLTFSTKLSNENLLVDDVKIFDNQASYDGAGIHIEDTFVSIKNILLLNNRADSRGGGLFVDKQGEMVAEHVTLMENYAE